MSPTALDAKTERSYVQLNLFDTVSESSPSEKYCIYTGLGNIESIGEINVIETCYFTADGRKKDKFYQDISIEVDGEQFGVNFAGYIFPQEIRKVKGETYGLCRANQEEYGYSHDDYPRPPTLYQQKSLFKKIMEQFPNNEFHVEENCYSHVKNYKICFDTAMC